jgi:2-polyprenyl-6-methoxyphenol hydroxylase-like FAD-dependent oxidoreductase
MTEDYIDVSIIGGGIGGLAAALALQLVNPHLKVKVFERDNQMSDRRQGYGLTLTNNKSGPLAKLGLLEDCINCNSTCPSNSHYTFDSNGNVIGYYGRAIKSKYFSQQSAPRLPEFGGNEGNLRIPRQELRSLLLQRLQPDTVVWGKKLIKFYENENEVEVHFDRDSNCDSTPVAADIIKTKILVGADGIKSVVRNLMDEQTSKMEGSEEKNTPVASSLKYIGISVIIGLSSSRKPHPLTHNRGFYVVDGTHRLFTMPFVRRKAKTTNPLSPIPAHSGEENEDETDVEDYLTMWQLSFSGLDEEQAAALKNCDTAELLQTALHRTASWFSAVRELLHQTIPNEIWATGLFDRDPMQVKAGSAGKRRWSRVTCLGDACHPMSMFKGCHIISLCIHLFITMTEPCP